MISVESKIEETLRSEAAVDVGGTDMTSCSREETQLWCKTNVHTEP